MRRQRKGMTMSILSMLDLLFGVFGSIIVLAAIVSTTITAQAEVTRSETMTFVAVEVRSEGNQLDLSPLYVSFEIIGADASLARFMPGRTDPVAGGAPLYASSTEKDVLSASLFLPPEIGTGRLRASLQNLPMLEAMPANAELIVSVALKTGKWSCSSTEVKVPLETLLAEDAGPRHFAPDLFRLDAQVECFTADEAVEGSDLPQLTEGSFAIGS
jgi:hypothetical protein